MTSSKRLAIALVISVTALAGSARAQRSAADIESARQLYNQGMQLRDAGDMRGAIEKFRAAHALGNTPITGIELCKAHAALGQPVEAREICLGVARIPPLAGETSRSQDARNDAARIAEDVKPRIASVRLHIAGVPQGREPTVTVDGAPVPVAALREPRALNPGQHQITARVGAGAETRAVVDVKEGENKELQLTVQAPAEEPIAPPGGGYERPAPRDKSNGLAIAGFVVGGIGVGVGAVSGIVAMSSESDLAKTCTDKICGPQDHDALDRARTWGTVSTAAFVIGAIGLVVGVTAVLTSPKSSSAALAPKRITQSKPSITPDFGPTGVGFHGSF
ncbi:MAG: hypothetical protein KF819_29650 [Labilithrix sp.]|nr:hypothetical protein [Labilithrix sp.]